MAVLCYICEVDKDPENFHKFCIEGRKRQFASACKECRKEQRYEQIYDTKCHACLKYRALDINGCCKKCNENVGLRQCRLCNQLLPLWMSFYGRAKKCKTCIKSRA